MRRETTVIVGYATDYSVPLQHAQKMCYSNVNSGDEALTPMLLNGLTDSAAQWLE
jgi:hypothetical protein